jgi:hypothetical protein
MQDLSSKTIPSHSNAATAVGSVNNNTLFLYRVFTTNTTMALFICLTQ